VDFLPSLQLLALATLLGVAVYTDLRWRLIPNKVTVPGLLVGLILSGVSQGGLPLSALAGVIFALVIAIPFMALGALGGGDAKLLAAVGAFVGPGGLLSVALYGALAGGVLALGGALRRRALIPVLRRSLRLFVYLISLGRHGERIGLDTPDAHSVPYGVAIAAGALATWFFPLTLGSAL
jgi:prepilin peptidase CpaA